MCCIIQGRREHIDCCSELGTCFGLYLKYRLDTRKKMGSQLRKEVL
jgi:hypothetical protein